MISTNSSSRNCALLTALLLTACSQPSGTETDNPVVQGPPYQSPPNFNPDDPIPPGCPPPSVDTQPTRGRYWVNIGETLLVGADYRGPLRVINVEAPQAPTLVATLPLEGNVLALASSGSHVAVVVQEPPDVPEDELSTEVELALVPRLVFFDLSEPKKPMRVAEADIDGEFWDLRARDGVVWLMSAKVALPDACRLPGQGCGYVTRTAMQVRGYQLASAGVDTIADVELPMEQRAWAADDGFVTETGSVEDGTHRLTVARISGQTLEVSTFEGETSPIHGSPVGVVGETLYVFSGGDSDSTLEVIDLGDPVAAPLAEVTGLPARPTAAVFELTRVFVGNPEYTQSGSIVSLDDPAHPVVTTLPRGVARAMPIEANGKPAVLGWGDVDGSGKVTFGLVSQDGAALSHAVRTELPTASSSAPEDAALYRPNTVPAGSAVAFLYHYYEPTERRSAIGRLDASTDPLTFTTHESNYGAELVGVGDWAYAPGFTGVTGVSLAVDAPVSSDAELTFEDYRLDLIDALPVGARTLSLVRTLDGIRLTVTDAAASPSARPSVLAELEVPNGATRLLPMGDTAAVLADYPASDCGQRGLACDEPSLVFVDPRGEPRILFTLPLPNPIDDALDVTSSQTNTWLSPVRLENGSWVLAREQVTTCLLVSECERLEIEPLPLSEVNIAFGSQEQDCPPVEQGKEPCAPSPAPREPEVYGQRTTIDVYRVDWDDPDKDSDDVSASLTELGRSTLELLDSAFVPLRAAGNTVLVTRVEKKLARGQSNATAQARFMLDTFDATTPGSTSALFAVNVPGAAVGLADDGQVVYTAEPAKAKGEQATLYRLHMNDGQAWVTATRALPGRYGDVRLFGDVALYVEQGADSCTPGAVHTIALDETLTVLGATPLTGGNWRYHDSNGETLLLSGPNYAGYAVFDATSGPAELAEFRAAAKLGPVVRLDDGQLWSTR